MYTILIILLVQTIFSIKISECNQNKSGDSADILVTQVPDNIQKTWPCSKRHLHSNSNGYRRSFDVSTQISNCFDDDDDDDDDKDDSATEGDWVRHRMVRGIKEGMKEFFFGKKKKDDDKTSLPPPPTPPPPAQSPPPQEPIQQGEPANPKPPNGNADNNEVKDGLKYTGSQVRPEDAPRGWTASKTNSDKKESNSNSGDKEESKTTRQVRDLGRPQHQLNERKRTNPFAGMKDLGTSIKNGVKGFFGKIKDKFNNLKDKVKSKLFSGKDASNGGPAPEAEVQNDKTKDASKGGLAPEAGAENKQTKDTSNEGQDKGSSKGFFSKIKDKFSKAKSKIKEKFSKLKNKIFNGKDASNGGPAPEAGKQTKDTSNEGQDKGSSKGFFSKIKDKFSKAKSKVKEKFSKAKGHLANFGKKIKDKFKNISKLFKGKDSSNGGPAPEAGAENKQTKDTSNEGQDKGSSKGFFSKIKDKFSKAKSKIKDKFSKAKSKVKEKLSKAKGHLANFGKKIKDKIKNIPKLFKGKDGSNGSPAPEGGAQNKQTKDTSNEGQDKGSSKGLFGKIKDKFSKAKSKIKDKFSKAKSKIKEKFGKAKSGLKKAKDTIVNGAKKLGKGISDKWKKISGGSGTSPSSEEKKSK